MFYFSLMIINGIYLIISSGRVVARRRKNNNQIVEGKICKLQEKKYLKQKEKKKKKWYTPKINSNIYISGLPKGDYCDVGQLYNNKSKT